jgi:cytochrome c553/uncharacterized protein (DUF302 family)
MKKLSAALVALCLSTPVFAADLANGEKINRSCALCHGAYGQGAPGKLSPRIAGMPKYYLIKAIKDYRDGVRSYPLMNKTSGLDQMTEQDIEDVSAYLASIDLSSDARFNIGPPDTGNVDAGEELFLDECKVCHNKDGYGKERKEAPPLAGQHPAYLYTVMKGFQAKSRIHDNDPEDETFLEYTDEQIINLAAHLARLDDDKIVEGYEFVPPTIKVASTKQTPEEKAGLEITNIQQTVVKMALSKGVKIEDAVQAMNSKAAEINLKLVGEQFVSRELENRGVDSPYLSIHQFCDPMDARTMIVANPIFSSYMPCRISVVEDQDGKVWMMMLNLDMLINSKLMPQDVVETAVKVNQQMLEVMVAGASGEF